MSSNRRTQASTSIVVLTLAFLTYRNPSFLYPALSKYHSDSGFIHLFNQGRLMMKFASDGCDIVGRWRVESRFQWSARCSFTLPAPAKRRSSGKSRLSLADTRNEPETPPQNVNLAPLTMSSSFLPLLQLDTDLVRTYHSSPPDKTPSDRFLRSGRACLGNRLTNGVETTTIAQSRSCGASQQEGKR